MECVFEFWGLEKLGDEKGFEWEGKEEEGIAEKGGKREEAERVTCKDSLSFLQFICCLLMAHEMQICKTNQPGLEKKKILLSFHRFISLFSVGNPKLKSFAAIPLSTLFTLNIFYFLFFILNTSHSISYFYHLRPNLKLSSTNYLSIVSKNKKY